MVRSGVFWNAHLLASFDCIFGFEFSPEMGGGDLDGDDFMVIWAPRFVPKEIVPPAVYSEYKPRSKADAAKEAWTQDPPAIDRNSFERMIAFFVHYPFVNVIGRISKQHKRWCYRLGVNSDIARRLAVCVSEALDTAKTGKSPELPDNWEAPGEKIFRPEAVRPDSMVSFHQSRLTT